MPEQTAPENSATIFDDVFHTIAQKLPRLMIALVNLAFGTHYPESVDFRQLRNEHYHKSGKIVTDSILMIGGVTYHFECQTEPDGTMVLRMLEYDFMIALEQAWLERSATVRLPSSCVVYLRHTKSTPDEHRMTILGENGQSMEYRSRVIKVQTLSLDEMFEKNLLMLLPYYIMRYEKSFRAMEEDSAQRERFLSEVEAMSDRLEQAVSSEDRTAVYTDLMELIREVAEYLLWSYEKTREGVTKIMGGRILPLPSDTIREAKEEGILEGRAEGRLEGEETMFHSIIRTMYEKGCSVLEIARLTGREEETVRDGLRLQGLAPQ